jgi:hypothetical protein
MNCTYSHEPKTFQYYDDVSVVLGTLRTFIAAFINAYYP